MEGKLYKDLVLFLGNETLPTSFSSNKSNFIRDARKFQLVNEHLKRGGRFVLREEELDDVWQTYHVNAFHSGNKSLMTNNFHFGGKPTCFVLGINVTYQKINEFYWCKGLQRWVSQKVRDCVVCCQKSSTRLEKARRAPLVAIPVTPKMWWRVHVDLCGPFNRSQNGCTFVGVGICAFLKYVEVDGNLPKEPLFLPKSLFLKARVEKGLFFVCLFLKFFLTMVWFLFSA